MAFISSINVCYTLSSGYAYADKSMTRTSRIFSSRPMKLSAPNKRIAVVCAQRSSLEIKRQLNHTQHRSIRISDSFCKTKLRNVGRLPGTKEFRVHQSAAAGPLAGDDNSKELSTSQKSSAVAIVGGLVLIAAMVTGALYVGGGDAQTLSLLKAGFISSFSIIFVSELGDKTFFIAALLAMKRGKSLVLTGAVAALSVMTVISVGIGMIFQKVPAAMSETSLPVGEWLGAALLVYFGVCNIKDALEAKPASEATEGEEVSGELADAEELLESAASTKQSSVSLWQGLVETFSLIFVAEWGDRSMLATIALAVAQNPFAVAAGAIVGHTGATIIAVVGGSILSQYISEKVVGLTGGVLFLVFAVATVLGVF